jgi:hypothetical protein
MTGIGRYVLLTSSPPLPRLKLLCNNVTVATRIIFQVSNRRESTDTSLWRVSTRQTQGMLLANF